MTGGLRSVVLGVLAWLLPLAILLVATAGVVPAAPEPEVAVGGWTEESDSLFAAARTDGRSPGSAASTGSWVRGLPLLPRLRATPLASPTPVQPQTTPAPDEEESSPEQLTQVEAAARAAVATEARQAPPGRPSGRLGSAIPPAVRRWEDIILRAADRTRLDPNLLAALMMTESEGHPGAVSPKGAVGLLQVMGGPTDPAANVQQGADILAGYVARYGGKLDLALAAYNAGPGAVDRYGGVPPYLETRDHVFRVLLRYDLYRGRR